MSKELNILQAIEMPVGTEFEIVYKNGIKSPVKTVLDKCKNFIIGNTEDEEEVASHDFITAKFIPIQKPVSFMEAVKSGKKIKVIHDDVVDYGFYKIDNLLATISENYSGEIVRKAIIDGKWYIEEE